MLRRNWHSPKRSSCRCKCSASYLPAHFPPHAATRTFARSTSSRRNRWYFCRRSSERPDQLGRVADGQPDDGIERPDQCRWLILQREESAEYTDQSMKIVKAEFDVEHQTLRLLEP